MRMILAAILICLSLKLAQAEVLKNISIETRSGVFVSALLITPSSPKAALIMMPGGPGVIDLSGTTIGRTRGFLSANFENFAAKKFDGRHRRRALGSGWRPFAAISPDRRTPQRSQSRHRSYKTRNQLAGLADRDQPRRDLGAPCRS